MRISDWSSDVCSSDLALSSFSSIFIGIAGEAEKSANDDAGAMIAPDLSWPKAPAFSATGRTGKGCWRQSKTRGSKQLLCHLKTGPFAARVFRCRHPWLGEEFWREGIEVHGRAEGVRHQAGRGGKDRKSTRLNSRH